MKRNEKFYREKKAGRLQRAMNTKKHKVTYKRTVFSVSRYTPPEKIKMMEVLVEHFNKYVNNTAKWHYLSRQLTYDGLTLKDVFENKKANISLLDFKRIVLDNESEIYLDIRNDNCYDKYCNGLNWKPEYVSIVTIEESCTLPYEELDESTSGEYYNKLRGKDLRNAYHKSICRNWKKEHNDIYEFNKQNVRELLNKQPKNDSEWNRSLDNENFQKDRNEKE